MAIGELIVRKNAREFFSRFLNTRPITRVHNIDNSLRPSVIMPPVWAQAILPAHIPYIQSELSYLHSFNIESYSRGSVRDTISRQVVENCCFPSIIQSDNENTPFVAMPPVTENARQAALVSSTEQTAVHEIIQLT